MPFTFSQTCVCLMVNLVLLNLTLFLIVHFCAVHGYAATHMCITHFMLLFHSATSCSCIMPLCYSPTHWDYISMDLVNFSLFFILSDHFRLRTVRRFPMGTHLSHALHHSTNTCLPHGDLVSLNLTLSLTVLRMAIISLSF